MADLVGIFVSAVGPIIAITGIGYILAEWKDVDPEPLSTAAVYVLLPALVFHSFLVTEFSATMVLRLAAGVVMFTVVMWGIAEVIGRAVGEEEPMLSALLLVAIFMNAGNLGLPVSDFAFGEVGRQTAIIFLSIEGIVMYTVGVYIASRSGGAARMVGIRRVFAIPLVYAIVAAVAVRALGVVPTADSGGMQVLKLVGEAAIPLMLLVLGIQLARTNTGAAVSRTWLGTALRFGVAPLVGLGVVFVLGIDDPTIARVFVLETAMPAAITPVLFVVEFAGSASGARVTVPEYVSTCVLVTTLIAMPFLTLLIAVLQSGIVI